MIEQVHHFKSTWELLRDDIQQRGSKVFMAHTPIIQTWSAYQGFLASFTDHTEPLRPKLTALHWKPSDVHRANDLQTQLDSHIQQLTLYLDLLEAER